MKTPKSVFRWLTLCASVVLVAAAGGAGLTSKAAAGGVSVKQACPTVVGTWSLTGSMAEGRYLSTATVLANGKVLVAGGSPAPYQSSRSSAELFDPSSGQWSSTGAMNEGRTWPTATRLNNGKILVVGGFDEGSRVTLASAELYDPASGTWSLTGRLSEARHSHQAQLLPDGRVLVFGGEQVYGPVLRSSELYDPATGAWAAGPDMNSPHAVFESAVLNDGRVLAAGGHDASGNIPIAEIYDPATNAWTLTGSMAEPHSWSTLTVMPDGSAIVAGGDGWGGALLASAERYDPGTGTWTALPPMSTARSQASQALLANGQLMVAGGAWSGGSYAISEVYDPATNSWQAAGALRVPAALQGVVILQDGRMLVAAGSPGNMGAALTAAEIFTIGGQPSPEANFSYWPVDPSVFDTVQFNDQSSDPDCGVAIESRVWRFGDGTASSDTNPSHKYAKDGSYTVTLTVTTSDGRTGTTSQTVEVRTHDVSILWASVTSKGRVGRTKPLQVGIGNVRNPETVQVDFYKLVPGGSEFLGTVTKAVPVMSKKKTTMFSWNYTFTDADKAAGKVNFQMVATILGGVREAYTGDNTIITKTTTVTR